MDIWFMVINTSDGLDVSPLSSRERHCYVYCGPCNICVKVTQKLKKNVPFCQVTKKSVFLCYLALRVSQYFMAVASFTWQR